MNIIILLTILLNAFLCLSLRPVQTTIGKVYGKRLRKYRDQVVGYFGIPFAEPPVKSLRFKPPVPLKNNTFKRGFLARQLARTCYFKPRYTGFIGFDYWHPKFLKYSEDCLQLNMWVPKKPNGGVLVFIFGRGYDSGSPSLDIYNGAVIAAKTKSIVVNINYRLDVLGFSTFKDGKVIPGNVGLLDQQVALKWVHDNVKYFGGDKKLITLFGEGTGAVSVAAHLYSEESSKYINRVILLSGSIKNTWAYQKNNVVSKNFMKLAKNLKCTGNDRQILKCLQSKDVKTLVHAADGIRHPEQSPLMHSFTIVENDRLFFKGDLTKKIFKKDMKKDIDVLIGKTSNESTYFMPQYLNSNKYGCNLNPAISINAPANQCHMTKINFEYAVELLASEYYLNNSDFQYIEYEYHEYKSYSYRDVTARLISDFTFDCDIVQYAKYIASFIKGNKYFFEFRVRSSSNPWPSWMGAMHSYELEYFFGMPFRHYKRYDPKKFSLERKFSESLIKMIGSFILKGEPEPQWKQFDSRDVTTLLIDKNFYKDKKIKYFDAYTQTCKVHDNVLQKYPYWKAKFNNP